MPSASWYAAGAEFLGLWLAMMVPMMLPSLLPTLLRFRRSVPGASHLARQGLTALVGLGYLAVWAALGAAVHAAGLALSALELRWGALHRLLPAVAGVSPVLAIAVQLTAWKGRQLARCRQASARAPGPTAAGAWRHGLALGGHCVLSCGNLMLALLAIGMMNPLAMAAVTLAVTLERLAPAPLAARAAGPAVAGSLAFLPGRASRWGHEESPHARGARLPARAGDSSRPRPGCPGRRVDHAGQGLFVHPL